MNQLYQKIFLLAKPYYLKGREADELHHRVVAEMMLKLLQEYHLDDEVLLAAALLHDIGYGLIPEEERREHWAQRVKQDHMRLGAEISEVLLEKADFPKEKRGLVMELVASHDDPELGIPLVSEEQKVLKEADILWMTTGEAFWLDVKRRPGLTPQEWLDTLERRFTGEEEYKGYLRSEFSQRKTRDFLERMRKELKRKSGC